MEPYNDDAFIQKTNVGFDSKGRDIYHESSLPFYPHVELGTAPIEVEHIEDLQKVRPFGVITNKNTSGDWTSKTFADSAPKEVFESAENVSSDSKAISAGAVVTDASTTEAKATTKKRESCLIESTRNSVRVSFLFKAQANAQAKANADPLEASILFQWMRLLMVQENHPLLRKNPVKGYSVSFLVTNRHLAIHGRETVEDSILDFCASIDKECSDVKLQVNAQARYVTSEFLKAFNNESTTED
jgi:actin related protein 2/3 complex subunit 4